MLSGPNQTIQESEPCDVVSVNVLSHCTTYGCRGASLSFSFPSLLSFLVASLLTTGMFPKTVSVSS